MSLRQNGAVRPPSTSIAIVGCGYISDGYMRTLQRYPQIQVVGAFDRKPERTAAFSRFWKVPGYESLAALLDDPKVQIVVNITNPSSHFEVSRAALEAGKHVYSEKPLAMDIPSARALVELSEQRGLLLSSAPSSLLGEAAQTVWKALRQGKVGPVRLVYAELDDGPVYRRAAGWTNESGAPWPLKDELEVGCTLEHAGYYLTWLTAFFGPARSLTSFARTLVPDKGVAVEHASPDFSIACIEFDAGVVARLTCGIVAPYDQSFSVVGDDGVLSVHEAWDYNTPVHLLRNSPLSLRLQHHTTLARLVGAGPRKLPAVRRIGRRFALTTRGQLRDLARGIVELADAVHEGRLPRLSARHGLHVVELTLATQDFTRSGTTFVPSTTFDPIEPMPWAMD